MDEGKLWSLIRNVLSQGGAIQLDRASMSGYEEYSARLDAAASERVADFAKLADARIAELELECSQWRDELRIYRETENKRIAELETDLELARRDVERYRWLRDESGNDHHTPWCAVGYSDPTWLTGEHLDAAIDAARAGNGGEG